MKDIWIRLTGAPLVAVGMQFAYGSNQAFTRWPLAAQHLAMGLVMTVALWEGTRGLLVLMRRLFPRHDQTPRRLVGVLSENGKYSTLSYNSSLVTSKLVQSETAV